MSIAYERKEPVKEKAERVEELKSLFSRYGNLLVLDIEDVPTSMIQQLRERLWGLGEFRVIKNRLAQIAIEEQGDEELKKLEKYLHGMRALFLSNEDIFKAARIISDRRKKLPPREGKTPYKDILIEEGGTGLKTGPEMRDLRVAKVPIRIIDGEIFVKERTTLVKEGETISPRDAKAMRILGIMPLEAKVDVVVGLDKGHVIPSDALTLSMKEYGERFNKGITTAKNLTIKANIPTKDTIMHQLVKTAKISFNLSLKGSLITPQTAAPILSSACRVAQKVQDSVQHSTGNS